jgi:hypothetical protein
VVLVLVEEPDAEELVEGELVDDELSPLVSFAAAPLDELPDEAPARLSVR